MNFRDTLITCKECGKQFIFTVERQRQMADHGSEVVSPDTCSSCTQRIDYGGKLHGRIKWFSLEKGYGFLATDDGTELFFHRTSVLRTEDGSLPSLEDGREVLYEVTEGNRGPQASQVELLTG
jgi:CspA family cold shock protein